MSKLESHDSDAPLLLGICGSLRTGSFNRRLLAAARSLLPPPVRLTTWDGLKDVPPFDEDDEHRPPAAVLDLREAIARADGLLIATPEYNGSVPGQLKNALDWASRPRGRSALQGKPAAVIGASPARFGAVRAQGDLRRVLSSSGARVIEGELAVARAPQQFTEAGDFADRELTERLRVLLGRLSSAAEGRLDAARAAA